VNLINEFHVALMPPRRRVGFLLGGAVSSPILQGYSETERLLKEVVDDGLYGDDPFFLVQRLVVFFRDCSTLSHKYISGVFNWQQGTQILFWSLDFEWN
jgi:hypothetical protein